MTSNSLKHVPRALPALSSPPPKPKKNAPPELAPIKSPSPPEDRFKGISLAKGWLECPLKFSQPHPDYRILCCKTPIDKEISEYLKIPKEKYFLPHTIYSLPNSHFMEKQQKQQLSLTTKRVIGLVIDLTGQMYYDQISFNNGKKTNKVKHRVIAMQNMSAPSISETSGFVGLVKSFLDGTNNQNKWIVVHDDLGLCLAGFMCCAFLVKELNYSVDAAVYQFSQCNKPGIYNPELVRLLHSFYSDKEDFEVFEQIIKVKPFLKPVWLQQKQKQKQKKSVKIDESGFSVPTTSIRRKQKRSFSEMNINSNNNSNTSNESLLSEPQSMSEYSSEQKQNSGTNIIMEPTLLEPPLKRQRKAQVLGVPKELKQNHPFLVAVRDEHLQSLTSIALQLSKTKELFHSILNKPATVPSGSLLALKANYRISWLAGTKHRFWLMILGKKGSFFVDPSYFECGKLGGIYHIEGTNFYDAKHKKYMDGTLCVGELVIDNISQTKKVSRFLITDLLVFDKQSLSKFPHTQRLMKAENYLYKPFAKSLQSSKLRIRVKPMYPIENKEIINKLKHMIDNDLPHQCDGLGLFPKNAPFGARILRIAL